jgi:hypothetical protein
VFAIDLDRFRLTPLVREPFEYVIVPGFIRDEAQGTLRADFPVIQEPGSFDLRGLKFGLAFARLLEELAAPDVVAAFGEKFGIDLSALPTVITVRGQSGSKDGNIHTDLPGKVITVLLYLNPSWESDGGRLRLLRSPDSLDDVIAEVPPIAGTLLAFRRRDNSWHGHKPFHGERRVVQMNWVTPQHRRALRRAELRSRLMALPAAIWRFAQRTRPRSHARA